MSNKENGKDQDQGSGQDLGKPEWNKVQEEEKRKSQGKGLLGHVREARPQIEKLSPKRGDLLIFHGLPDHISSQAFIHNLEKSNTIPEGVSVLVVPENMDVHMTEEATLLQHGYVKSHMLDDLRDLADELRGGIELEELLEEE